MTLTRPDDETVETARVATEGQPGTRPLEVLVTGMHRSGTSAVGSLLASAGLYAGPPEHQMSARRDNPAGFAELQPVADFNDDLLASIGWRWDTPTAKPAGVPHVHEDVIVRGRRLVETGLGSIPWFVKDPRLCLLLPWWRRMLLDRFVVIVTVRPAYEVAWSLAVRDGFSISLGLALYAAYYRHLAAGLDGLPAIAVNYQALTEKPDHVVPQLLASLAKFGVATHPDGASTRGVIRPLLRRGAQDVDNLAA